MPASKRMMSNTCAPFFFFWVVFRQNLVIFLFLIVQFIAAITQTNEHAYKLQSITSICNGKELHMPFDLQSRVDHLLPGCQTSLNWRLSNCGAPAVNAKPSVKATGWL